MKIIHMLFLLQIASLKNILPTFDLLKIPSFNENIKKTNNSSFASQNISTSSSHQNVILGCALYSTVTTSIIFWKIYQLQKETQKVKVEQKKILAQQKIMHEQLHTKLQAQLHEHLSSMNKSGSSIISQQDRPPQQLSIALNLNNPSGNHSKKHVRLQNFSSLNDSKRHSNQEQPLDISPASSFTSTYRFNENRTQSPFGEDLESD